MWSLSCVVRAELVSGTVGRSEACPYIRSCFFCSRVGWQLYDLMTMAFKYQVLLCPRPKDVLLVTFNHLDAIKGLIQDSPTILHQVDETFRQLTDVSGLSVCVLSAPKTRSHSPVKERQIL